MNVSKSLHLSRTIGWCLAALVLLAAAPAGTADLKAPFLLQKPTLSQTRIVFVFADDLWTVPREGGEAARLTSSPGLETNPVFSPDGSLVAFTGEYDGNVDVFIVPAAGGVPRRLTWHPAADTASAGPPTASASFSVRPATPIPVQRALHGRPRRRPRGEVAAAHGLRSRLLPGRQAPRLCAPRPGLQGLEALPRRPGHADLDRQPRRFGHREVPRDDSNDFNPMWVGDKVYFLCDREGAVTLYFYDPASRKVARAFENTGLDLKSASAGPGAIVYEQFGGLDLFDLQTGKTTPVPSPSSGDLPEVRER